MINVIDNNGTMSDDEKSHLIDPAVLVLLFLPLFFSSFDPTSSSSSLNLKNHDAEIDKSKDVDSDDDNDVNDDDAQR